MKFWYASTDAARRISTPQAVYVQPGPEEVLGSSTGVFETSNAPNQDLRADLDEEEDELAREKAALFMDLDETGTYDGLQNVFFH